MEETVKILVDKLRESTPEVKAEWLLKIRIESERDIKDYKDWTIEGFCKKMEIECSYYRTGWEKDGKGGYVEIKEPQFPPKLRYTWYHDQFKKEQTLAVQSQKEGYLERNLKWAEDYYEAKLEKLAQRILDFNLDVKKVTCQTAKVKQNLETIVTDGNKRLRAWTIIAEGPIISAHYRYLVREIK